MQDDVENTPKKCSSVVIFSLSDVIINIIIKWFVQPPAIRTQKRLNTGTDKLQIITYSAVHENTVCGLRYKTTTQHTKKKKLRKHCTHDNYLQLEIDPVLDGFVRKRHYTLYLAVHSPKTTFKLPANQHYTKPYNLQQNQWDKNLQVVCETIATNCETNTKATPRKKLPKEYNKLQNTST